MATTLAESFFAAACMPASHCPKAGVVNDRVGSSVVRLAEAIGRLGHAQAPLGGGGFRRQQADC